MTAFLHLVVWLLVLAGIVWLVRYFAVPQPFRKVIEVLAIVVGAILVLRFVFALLGIAFPF